MAEEKLPVITYAEDVPQQDFRPIPWQIRVDGCESGMQCFYSAHWCYPRKEEPGKADAPKPSKVGHPPHLHKENEIMMLIGGDPDDPYDLGATVEFCIGKDMKKYTFTRSVTIMIPSSQLFWGRPLLISAMPDPSRDAASRNICTGWTPSPRSAIPYGI